VFGLNVCIAYIPSICTHSHTRNRVSECAQILAHSMSRFVTNYLFELEQLKFAVRYSVFHNINIQEIYAIHTPNRTGQYIDPRPVRKYKPLLMCNDQQRLFVCMIISCLEHPQQSKSAVGLLGMQRCLDQVP
jgi:hypothetical protein